MRRLGLAVALVGMNGWGNAQAPLHAPDGQAMERLQSITIVPAPNAPFRATVVTEWTKLLPDGTTSTMKNHRTVARDSSGRVFEERRYFSPNGDTAPVQLASEEYKDPNRHEMSICYPTRKVCYLYPYSGPPTLTGAGSVFGGPGSGVTTESLGTKMIGPLQAVGSREVTTIQTGVIGNVNPQPIVKEFWYSPHLQINLLVERFDPRSGMQNFMVNDVSLTEPDPTLLTPPAEYQVVKMTPPTSAGH